VETSGIPGREPESRPGAALGPDAASRPDAAGASGLLVPWAGMDAAALSPTWAELTALPPSHRSGPRIGGATLIVMLGGLAILAVLAGILFMYGSEKGQVMFTTIDPNGGNGCVVTNRVTAIDRGTHAWMVVVFKSPVGKDQMSVQFRQNGVYLGAYTWPVEEEFEKAGCTWGEDLATYEPGDWTFTILRNGKVEEEGTLTIR
jgi:hypothetical protein